jgi:hypothetical protein
VSDVDPNDDARFEGHEPSARGTSGLLAFLRALVLDKVPVQGVLLYGLARESHQPEAEKLSALSRAWLESFARQIEAQGMPVAVIRMSDVAKAEVTETRIDNFECR